MKQSSNEGGRQIFTLEETSELKAALANGGTFLRISKELDNEVHVLKGDGNGGFKSVQTLGDSVSLKLFELYSEPIPMGYHMIGLEWFINKYC